MVHAGVFSNPNLPSRAFLDLSYNPEAAFQGGRPSVLKSAIGKTAQVISDNVVVRILGDLGHRDFGEGRCPHTGGDEGHGSDPEGLQFAAPDIGRHDKSGFGGSVNAYIADKSQFIPVAAQNWKFGSGGSRVTD